MGGWKQIANGIMKWEGTLLADKIAVNQTGVPNANLEVVGTAGSTVFRLTRDTTGNYFFIQPPGGSSTTSTIGTGTAGGGAANIIYLTNGSVGVGIGTQSPTSPLEVSGSMVVSGTNLGLASYAIGASGGLSLLLTTAGLVGNTMLFSGGILVGFGTT